MNQTSETVDLADPPMDAAERRLERLIDRLPGQWQAIARWLRRPSSRAVRIPAGTLLVAGGFLSILPFFGLWMLPLGATLLAEDVPPLRRLRDRVLDRIERHRPHWFAGGEAGRTTQAPLPSRASSLSPTPGGAPAAGSHQ